jgi:cell division protein FtsI (penicillin-binding protein 3)
VAVRSRLLLVVAALAIWIVGIGARLYDLQVTRHEEFARRAERQQQRVIELDPPRGTIRDARGRELAVSVEVESAFAVPREVADVAAAARALGRVLGADRARLERQLSSDREFVWVARKLDPPQARAVRDLGLAGIYFLEESKRYYPLRETAAHVLGYVGTDNQGLAGLEAMYDRVVAGKPGRRTVLRDAKAGMAVPPDLPSAEPVPGRDLWLTLDAAIQGFAEEELAAAVTRLRARSGAVVLLDPASGAVLAMASYPTFDPNRFGAASEEAWRNRAVADAYEPGSTFKMVTAAAALEQGLVDPDERIDCESGGITLAGVRIADHKAFGTLSFREVIAKSSNVCTIKTALRVANRDFYATIRGFGFGRTTGVDLPGESPGLLMPVERWPALAKAYISFGQGISVTPLQLTRAFGSLANGGRLLEPYVVRQIGSGAEAELQHAEPIVQGEPVSPATRATLVELLAGVTVEGGTGQAAAVAGYPVAGKTGTAQKASPGRGYLPDEFVASFVGFTPVERPALVGLVVLDDPRGNYHGGEAAAPIFGAIARKTLLYLNVRPERERPEQWPFERAREAVPAGGEAVAAASLAAAAPAVAAAAAEELASAGPWPPPGTVPDLVGRTAREALMVSASLHLAPVLRGAGVVLRQAPAPGSPLPAPGGRLEVWLGRGGAG